MLGERYDTHLELNVHRLKYLGMVLDIASFLLFPGTIPTNQIPPIDFLKGIAKFKRDNIIDHIE